MKLISAPMATISHPAFRILVEKFGGCDEYYNEMINAPSLLNKGPFEKFYINPFPAPEKMVWQITGRDVPSMAKAACELSFLPGLGIDINMGCSAPEIVKSGAGIAWMLKDISETECLVREVRSALENCEAEDGRKRKRLSVKCRLGPDDFTESGFFLFTDMLVKNGVERITLHPRTQKEKYRTRPRYEYAEKLALRYKNEGVEVVVNGDVSSQKTFLDVVSACPSCSAVMIGRASVQKPWIFAELKKIALSKPIFLDELAFSYIEGIQKYQPPEFWKTRIKRFFSYYADNFSFAHYLKIRIMNASSVDETKLVLNEYFLKVPEDRMLNL